MSMQMNPRERALAFIVGTMVVGLISYMLVNTFLGHQRKLKQDLSEKKTSLETMQTLIAERAMWEERDKWLNQSQPKMDNANSAGVELLDRVKQIGQTRSLTPTDASFGVPDPLPKSGGKPAYQATSVTFTVKGKWADMVNFLFDVQTPTNFLIFEKATLQLDKDDKTQVSGTFKVAKWYAVQ